MNYTINKQVNKSFQQAVEDVRVRNGRKFTSHDFKL